MDRNHSRISLKPQKDPISGRALILSALALLLATSWILFCQLGTAHLWKSEGRVGEVVREMFVRGDFIHPTSGWQPHISKPLIPYWLAVAASKVHGGLDEWSLRLPSAIAGLIAVFSTVVLGMRLFSAPVGLTAGAILASSLGLALWGRCAAADMLSLMGIIISVTWYWSWRDRPGILTVGIFGLLIAVAAQMKGLVGMAIPLIVVGADILMTGRYKGLLRPSFILALLAGVSAYLIPFVLSSYTADTQGFNWISRAVRESVVRFINPYDHRGSPWMYTYFIPIWLLPWTPLFLYALISAARDMGRGPYEQRWLLIDIVVIFCFFTLSGSRRSYYILPILPFCALLTGQAIICLIGGRESKEMGPGPKIALWAQIALFSLPSLGLIGLKILPHRIDTLGLPQGLFRMAAISGGAVLFFVLIAVYSTVKAKRLSWPGLIALLGAGVMTTGGVFCMGKPVVDRMNTEKSFVLDIKTWLGEHLDAVPAYYRVGAHRRPGLSFYLDRRRPIPVLRDQEDLEAFISLNPSWVIICMREDEKGLLTSLELCRAGYRQLMAEAAYPWEGYPNKEDLEKRKKYGAYFCLQRKLVP